MYMYVNIYNVCTLYIYICIYIYIYTYVYTDIGSEARKPGAVPAAAEEDEAGAVPRGQGAIV